jgi:hypothetical protein
MRKVATGQGWIGFALSIPRPVAPVNCPFPGSGATTPTTIARFETVTAITQSGEKYLHSVPIGYVSQRKPYAPACLLVVN